MPARQTAESTELADRFMQAFAVTPTLLGIMEGPDHTWTFANEALSSTLCVSDPLGLPVAQATPVLARPSILRQLDRVLRTGEPANVAELPFRTKILSLSFHPLHDDTGATIGIIFHGFDITTQVIARRAAEQHAADSLAAHHRCTALLDSIPDVAWLKDDQLRFIAVNGAMTRYTGFPQSYFVGKTDFDLHPFERAAAYEQEDLRVLADGGPIVTEHILDVPGKPRRVFETVKVAYQDHTGHAAGVAGMSRDVTPRKAAEETLQAREEQYRLIVEGSEQIFFYLHDADGILQYVSPSIAGVLGYDPHELVGRHYDDILAPDISQEFVHSCTDTALATGEAQPAYNVWTQHKDGRAVCVEITERPLLRAGHPVTMHGFARDITERYRTEEALRKSEALFRAMTEHSTEIVGLLHADGTFKYVGPSVSSHLGYTPDELAGQRPSDYTHPDDVGKLQRLRTELLKAPGAEVGVTVRLRHKDGSWRYFEGNARNLLDVPGAEGITLNARDVTTRVEASEQLVQSQKMEAVGRLAAGVAHDFNNILTAIQGHGELLLDSLDATEAREDAQEILKAAERATALTRQLLAFSRKQHMQSQVLDPCAIVAGLRKMLQRLIGEHIELDIRAEQDTAPIKADPGQIEQVLLNLVVNARDAMPTGGRIGIRVHNTFVERERAVWGDIPSDTYVAIEVTDTGSGIQPADLAHIFEPFFTTKTPDKGTGLGLATVYGIVRQSGGYLKVQSEVGRGTHFTVLLPVAAEQLSLARHMDTAVRHQGNEVVLVVEDEPSVRSLVARVLTREGYTVLQADSGAAALITAQQAPDIDVLLTDIVMPIMNGCALASALAVTHPRCKVLYMSGHNDEMIARYGVADGGFYLKKPFRTAELSSILRRVIETN